MRWICALILSLSLQCVWAQQTSQTQPAGGASRPAAAQPLPTPEEVNPAVDTTPAATPAPETSAPAAPPATAAAAPGSGPKGKSEARSAHGASPDRVELGTTDITGNRELPKVLYIVPWKRSDLGDLLGKPPNSLLDEVLQPIDRDVFLRENRYYDALHPGRPPGAADSVQGSGDKPSR